MPLLQDIEVVDVSLISKRRPSGHVYHLYNSEVVADLARLVNTGQSAGERPNLQQEELDGIAYWRLTPNEQDVR